MRKLALLLAMIFIIDSVVPHTLSAAENRGVYTAADNEQERGVSDTSSDNTGLTDGEDAGAPVTDAEENNQDNAGETTGTEDTDIPEDGAEPGVSDQDGNATDADENAEEQSGEASDADGADSSEEPENPDASDEQETGSPEDQSGENDASEVAEDEEPEEEEFCFPEDPMEASVISYKLYDKAHETPRGYLAVLMAQAGASVGAGRVTSLTYTIDGKTYEAELVRNAEDELKVVGFYLDKNLTGSVKTVFVRMRYTIGQGSAVENTFESSQRIQLIKVEKSMTYSASAGKTISDGQEIRIALSLYTGTPDKVKYTKVALKKSGGEEKAIAGSWAPTIQSKDNVQDPRYESDYGPVSPYTEYIEGVVPCGEAIQDGTYDLILYQKGSEIERQVFTGYVNVTHQNAIYDGGYVKEDNVFSMDNSGSECVTIWVYGLGLSKSTVPVLYQTISGRKRAVTSSVLGFEPLTGAKEGAVYCLKKDGFRNDINNTTIRFSDGQVFDANNKAVVECAYHFNEMIYSVSAKEAKTGVLSIEPHIECDAEKIMIYLAEAYAKADSSATVSVSGQQGEEIIHTDATVKKNASGRLYIEVGKDTFGYERLRIKAAYKATVYNADGTKASADFCLEEPGMHKSNLTVPAGCTWEICRVNMLPGHIMDGSKAGKNVLSKTQLSELQKYGPVRYKILKDDVVIKEEKAIFGSGKAPKREPTPEERVESGASPVLVVVADSLTVTDVKIAVKIPEYIRKNPSDNYYVQLIVEDVRGMQKTFFEKYNGRASQIFSLSYEPDGSSYAATARMVYSATGAENSPYNVFGKISKQLIVTLKDPYEKSLQISGDNVKILQGETDVYNVARIDWKNAHERYRVITAVELVSYPEDADVTSVKRALQYNSSEHVIKLNAAMLDWSKLPAGQYRVRVEALQRAEKKAAERIFAIRIKQGVYDMTVCTDSSRYYKEKGKELKIKTILKAVDYTGKTIQRKDMDKLTFQMEKDVRGMEINPGNGSIIVSKGFVGEETNQVSVYYRNNRYVTPVFKVTNTKCHIQSVGVDGISEERLAEGSFKAYEIHNKQIVVMDDEANRMTGNVLKYIVKGHSVKVDQNGVIHTTGTAGKSTITCMINDGSKENAKIDITVANDAVSLNAHDMNGAAVRLVSAETGGYNALSLGGGNYLCLDVIGSNGQQVKDGTTDYRLRAKKGRFVDYGKAVDGAKQKSGKFIYIPASNEDVITLVDKSVTPAAVTTYKISIAAYDNKTKLKVTPRTTRVYETGAADTYEYKITGGSVDYAGYTAILGFDCESRYKNEKIYKKYGKMAQYIQKPVTVGAGNIIKFNIPNREKLPLGTYNLKLYLYKGNKELAPVNIRWKVMKCKKAYAKLTSKELTMRSGRKQVKLGMEAINCRSMEMIGVDAAYIGTSYFKNKFPDYFELAVNEKGQYLLICKAAKLKDVPLKDRVGTIRYRAVDLAGISHERTMKVQITFK